MSRASGGVLERSHRDDAEDPQALARAAHQTGARLVYLANPDNLMGSWHKGARINAMLDDLPRTACWFRRGLRRIPPPADAIPTIDPEGRPRHPLPHLRKPMPWLAPASAMPSARLS